jgi:predicted NBD/HSP70 family sugar kinase
MASERQQPARLARYNRAVVLDLIRRFGPIPRSDLAERSGLAPSSVLNIIGTLSRSGLVRSVSRSSAGRGRPAALVELNREARSALGINLRITGVEAVLLDLLGNVVADTALPLQGGSDPESVVRTVLEAVDQVVRLARVDLGRVLGAGVGCPGPVIHGRELLNAPGFPAWDHVPLAEMLERQLGLPVTLENDANLGALAEYIYGLGLDTPGCDQMVYVHADHGIGAGIIIDGKLYRGTDGLAGEVGHTVIDLDGPQCSCGRYGCLEALASVGAIIRRTALAARLGGITSVAERLGGDWSAVSYAAISDAVAAGDVIATAAVDEAIRYLAVGVANIALQFRPSLIVVGGQLFDYGDAAFDRLQAALSTSLGVFGAPPTPIALGELGPGAPSIGAASLILEGFFGVPQQVIASSPPAQSPAPSFEETPIWPRRAEQAALLATSAATVVSADNLRPAFTRVRAGDPVTVMIDVVLDGEAAEKAQQVKTLLHWDRVTRFGTPWPNPKNSPMQLAGTDGARATYTVTLASLPSGMYEFTAHVLGRNDIWIPENGLPELNGRVEVVLTRAELSRRIDNAPSLLSSHT